MNPALITAHSDTARAVAAQLAADKQAAEQQYLAHRRPVLYFRQHGAALDRALRALWQTWFADSRLSLLATGGYGRGELYPYSDLDLAVTAPTPPDEAEQAAVAAFVQTLWDLHLAPAVKTGSVAELCASAAEDLSADTAFLEARHLAGDAATTEELLRRINLRRDVVGFIEGKILEQQQRHAKSQGAGTVLEANLKSAPGGLRDIHTLLWIAKAQGIDPRFQALVQQRILSRTEAALLVHSHRRLAQIRISLHLAARREEDRLVFDLQQQAARLMGFDGDNPRRNSEKLMHSFYRAVKTVTQLSGILLPMLRGRVYSRLPRVVADIDDDYYQVGNLLAVRDKQLFARKPTHIFKAMQIVQQRSDLSGLAPKTLRAWWAAGQNIDAAFYQNPVNRDRFIGFFRHGSGLTHLLRFLNLYGVLARYLPAWDKIVGLLQHDLFHIYPVDDHILTVVRNMRRLALDAHSHELPFASALMHAYPQPHILYLAALFHDIAKGRGGDHALEGIADARRFAADHFLDSDETELLAWLVEDHLLMSGTAQKEDIQDPDVVARFCQRVRNRERLTALYLLTVADIRGTNPKIWNSWKATLLENLFQAALRHLEGNTDDRSVSVSRRQQAALGELARLGVDEAGRRKLWRTLGEAYFVRHEMQEILWHLPLLAADSDSAQAHTRLLPDGHTLEAMVYMPNRAGLFAGLCQIFSHHNLNILAARAYITEHQYILDTFILQAPEHCLPEDWERIRHLLLRDLNRFVYSGGDSVTQPPERPGRRSRHLPIATHITISAEDNPGWYVLYIVTANRRFLLANIARVLSEHNIGVRYAKITTLDERAEDSFLVYAPQLAETRSQLELKQALLARIDG
nr:[protein-PII] uridylyltransferase [Neisseria sp. HSC-16F19]